MRCNAKTVKGTRCKKTATVGGLKCLIHKGMEKSISAFPSKKAERLTSKKANVVYNKNDSKGAFDYFILSTWYEDRLVDVNTSNLLTEKDSVTLKTLKELGATLIGVSIFNDQTHIANNFFSKDIKPFEKKLFSFVKEFRKEPYGEAHLALFKLDKKKKIGLSIIRNSVNYCSTFTTDNYEDRFTYKDKKVAVFFIYAESDE